MARSMRAGRERPLTCFGGLLALHGAVWRWRSGRREPAISLVPSHRVALAWRDRAGGGDPLVEVPVAVAQVYDPLAWLLDGDYPVDLALQAIDVRHDAAPPPERCAARCLRGDVVVPPLAGVTRFLVPLRRWRQWCSSWPQYPVWHRDDLLRLMVTARTAGWLPHRQMAMFAVAR